MTAEPPGLRELLRSQRVFPDGMPEFDPHAAPGDPVALFLRWLEAALKDAVPAPHAMTLATADDRGRPSSRVTPCVHLRRCRRRRPRRLADPSTGPVAG
jgi:pyridoxamine 5'-phosphate oxidase